MPTLYSEAITITPQGFPEAERLLASGESKMRTIVKNVLANTIEFTDKEIRRLVLNRYDITPGSLNDQSRRARFYTKVVLPTRQDLAKGRIEVHSNRFPVMRFNVIPESVPPQKGIPVSERQTVSVITVKGKAQVGKANRFVAKMQSGHIGVFMRKPDATHRKRPDGQNTELNISEEHMVSVAEMIQSKELRPILQKKIRDRVEQRFNYYADQPNWIRRWLL